jgi:ElaB/YqjD/DUF883 family membrane-anchored ribosome-binding protein
MPDEEHLIKQRMERKRVDLADKIETLENTLMETVQHTLHDASNVVDKVEQTVENVTDAVTDSVEAVKEKVEESVEAVKKTFNISRHVDRHPWAMVGGAVLLGFLGGRMLGRRRAYVPPPRRRGRRSAVPMTAASGPETSFTAGAAPAATEEERPSWFSRVGETYGEELSKLKGLAVGATLGALRDMLTSAAPEPLRPQLADVMNGFTTKLGGRVFEQPLIDTGNDSCHQEEDHDGHSGQQGSPRPMAM